jgi:3-phosphoshikimate 1-carboxyvinyltransferase
MDILQTSDGWLVKAGNSLSSGPLSFDFTAFSDTFLTLAAVAPLVPFPVTINGIGHTRFQETDRIHGMATELKRIGARVDERESSMTIYPFNEEFVQQAGPVIIETYKDHRVAMSFGILGCSNRFGEAPWLQIADPGCCGKTFPRFFDELNRLYRLSHDK